MLISPSPQMPEVSFIIALLLIFCLIVYEILHTEHKSRMQRFLISTMLAFFTAFVFIIIQRLEALL